MAAVPIQILKCPHCDHGVDCHVMHLYSMLGPSVVKCPWCRKEVGTDRVEWFEMNRLGKMYFICMSVLYGIAAFFLGAAFFNSAIQLLVDGTFPNGWELAKRRVYLSGTAFAVIVAMIQLRRVMVSRQRSQALDGDLRTWAFSFDVGGQFKMLLLLLSFPGIAWLLSVCSVRLPETTSVVMLICLPIAIGIVLRIVVSIYGEMKPAPESVEANHTAGANTTRVTIHRIDQMPDCCLLCGATGTKKWSLKFAPQTDESLASVVLLPRVMRLARRIVPSIPWSLPFCPAHARTAAFYSRFQGPLIVLGFAIAGSGIWSFIATNLTWPLLVACVFAVVALFFAHPYLVVPGEVTTNKLECRVHVGFADALSAANQIRPVQESGGQPWFPQSEPEEFDEREEFPTFQ